MNRSKIKMDSSDVENDTVMCGISNKTGLIKSHGNIYTCILDYDENTSLYGLFSGHGGNEVAQYAVEALPPLIKNDLYYSGQYKKALIKAFIDFDGSLTKSVATQRMRFLRQQNIEANNFVDFAGLEGSHNENDLPGIDNGCSATVALIVKSKLYVASVGDSKCIISINGDAYEMSVDHTPINELELKRILTAGGIISQNGQINHGLNMSRALGDHKYKMNTLFPNTKQMIIALPEVRSIDIKPENGDFVVLGCRVIWDTLSCQNAAYFISNRISIPENKLSMICEELFDVCMVPDRFNRDIGYENMTCMIIKLKYDRTNHSQIVDSGPPSCFQK